MYETCIWYILFFPSLTTSIPTDAGCWLVALLNVCSATATLGTSKQHEFVYSLHYMCTHSYRMCTRILHARTSYHTLRLYYMRAPRITCAHLVLHAHTPRIICAYYMRATYIICARTKNIRFLFSETTSTPTVEGWLVALLKVCSATPTLGTSTHMRMLVIL